MQFLFETVCLISVYSLLCFKGNGGAAAAPQNGAAIKGNGNFKKMALLLLNGSKCDLYGDGVPLTLSLQIITMHGQEINDFLLNMAGYGAPAGGYGGLATKGNGILRNCDFWVLIAEGRCVSET